MNGLGEVLELSSDSDDTIVQDFQNMNDADVDEYVFKCGSDLALSTGPNSSRSSESAKNPNIYSLDEFSDEDIRTEPLLKRIKSSISDVNLEAVDCSKKTFSSVINFNAGDFCEDFNQDPDILTDINTFGNIESSQEIPIQHDNKKAPETDHETSPKTKRRKTDEERQKQKLEMEMAKEAKKMERELKKLQVEKEKAEKKALKLIQKNLSADECIKNILVNMDNTISSSVYGSIIENVLKDNGYSIRKFPHNYSHTITWTRKTQTLEDVVLNTSSTDEVFLMKIFSLEEFLKIIESDSLKETVLSLNGSKKRVILAIIGLRDYYKYLKNVKNEEFRSELQENKKKKKKTTQFDHIPKIQRFKIENALNEVQILTKCQIRIAQNYEDLASFVLQCSKSIAQIPYKQMKQQKYEQKNEYYSSENRDCVNVDKFGNGLNRLYNQILTLFPMARLEHAEAITSVYPTLNSLYEAYKKCESRIQGETLLENLQIRRAAGPLSTTRRVGPELSKKVYNFFMSKEDVFL